MQRSEMKWWNDEEALVSNKSRSSKSNGKDNSNGNNNNGKI